MVKIDPKAGMWTIDNTLLPQLRMQALEIITRTRAYSSDKSLFQAIDLYVHYCLTGEHQLPEKKE